MLSIEKIKYKNILSSGNQFIEIDLNTHSTTLIRGTNGQGKSLIITALIFGLYGKSNRGITKKQLVNSVNKKDCVVEIEFSNDGKRYKIKRGISPNIFEIHINGKLQEELSAVKDQQKYLEQNILKMSYKTFMQVVVLGSTNYIPFMELSAADRRSLVEELLDIKIFSTMNLLLKDKIKNVERNKREIEIERAALTTSIDSQKNLIDTIKNSGKDTITRKEIELEELQQENNIAFVKIEESEVEIKDLNENLDSLEFNSKKIKQFSSLFGKLQQKRSLISEEIAFFTDHSICPTCKQEVEFDFKSKRITDLDSELIKLKEGEEELLVAIKEEETREKEFKVISEEIRGVQSVVSRNQNQINSNNRQIQKIQNEIKYIQESIENQQENTKQLQKLVRRFKKLEKQESQCNEALEYFEFSHLLMKDGGIKSKIIENYLPVMNAQINKYLQMLDLYINFTLDSEFNEAVKTPIHEDFSYGSFSEGEKQRINLALLLAWRDIARMKNSVNCNIMFFDETLDSSLDGTGIEDLLKIINYIVKDSNIFIISHRDGYEDKFERVIEVKKVNGFTKIFT